MENNTKPFVDELSKIQEMIDEHKEENSLYPIQRDILQEIMLLRKDFEDLSKELELLKLKDIADIKTAIKVLNSKLEKIVVIQESVQRDIQNINQQPIDLIKTLKLHSDSIGEITKALANAVSAGIKMSSSGQGIYGEYEQIEDYIVAYEVVLSNNGLKISFMPWENEKGQEYMIGILSHESGEWFKALTMVTAEERILKDGGYSKAIAAGRTYAKKSLYASLMGS